jgi:hypothetical protein
MIGTKAYASTSSMGTTGVDIVKPVFYDEGNKRLVS